LEEWKKKWIVSGESVWCRARLVLIATLNSDGVIGSLKCSGAVYTDSLNPNDVWWSTELPGDFHILMFQIRKRTGLHTGIYRALSADNLARNISKINSVCYPQSVNESQLATTSGTVAKVQAFQIERNLKDILSGQQTY